MTRRLPRFAGMLILLALILGPVAVFAQDGGPVVAGSGVVAPLFEALAQAAGAEGVTVSVTGTTTGLQNLCQNTADVTLATRAMTAEEEAACVQAGVNFVEVPLAYDVLAVIANPTSDSPDCLTSSQLRAALAPSSEGQIVDWVQIGPDFPAQALTVVLPPTDSATYALADTAVEGAGLRGDVTAAADDQAVIDSVSQNAGALGVVRLPVALAAGDTVQLLDLDNNTGVGCQEPGAENVESRVYSAASTLYAYANTAALDNAAVQNVMSFASSADAAAAVASAGFTAPSADTLTQAAQIVADRETGRAFSNQVSDFEVPTNLVGVLTLVGEPVAYDYVQQITTDFTGLYPQVTLDAGYIGLPAAIDNLCANTADIAISARELSSDDIECEDGSVNVENIQVGSDVVVLVSNAASDYLACLTDEQITTAWRAQAGDPISTWNQVDASFPEADIFLFAPEAGASVSDTLMILATGISSTIRVDVAEENADPLYRAAATANVEGGLTFMRWADYEQVLDNNQAGIQLVGIGPDCVVPGESTIEDGTYPLALPVVLVANQASLVRPEVQTFLWTVLSDANYALLAANDLVGVPFGDLPALRASLQAMFDEAAVQAVIDAEATPEPESTVEATAEATEDAGAATAEPDAATAEPTAEATAGS